LTIRRVIGLLAVTGLMVSFLALGPSAGAARNPDVIPNQYIITFNDTVPDPPGLARAMAAREGLTLLHTYEHALRGFAAVVPPGRMAALQTDPNVRTIVEDRLVSIAHHRPGHGGSEATPTPTPSPTATPSAGLTPTATSIPTTTDEVPTGIRRIFRNVNSSNTGAGIGVAVIDTGIQSTHPDLQVHGGVNCSTGTSYDDGNGHGTHVAGTIAAKKNGTGVIGVAPDAKLYAVRVLNNAGSGSWSSIICGVDWVTNNAAPMNIKVANMSLGGSGGEGSCTDGGLRQAICNSVAAGVTYVVAAGNSSADAANYVPATFPEVITVSALADFNGLAGGGASSTCRNDVDDTFADFSNHGADVDIIAPGVCIKSTWKGSSYNTISGTSMAAPHVAGAAALYVKVNAGHTPSQVKSALQSAGNLDWNNADDRDSTKEKLLDVSGY
jgi:subtilisin